jgi:hypothetical protein
VVGAIDRRVKCVVAQVPLISGHANARRLIRADFIAQVQAACPEDRKARYQGIRWPNHARVAFWVAPNMEFFEFLPENRSTQPDIPHYSRMDYGNRVGFWRMLDVLNKHKLRACCCLKPPGMIPVVSENPMGAAVLPTTDSWRWFTETARSRAPAWRNEVTLRSVEMFLEYEPGAYIAHISPTPLMVVVALGDHLTVADEALAAYERALEPKRLVMLPGGHFDAYLRDFAAASGAACQWFREHLLTTDSP